MFVMFRTLRSYNNIRYLIHRHFVDSFLCVVYTKMVILLQAITPLLIWLWLNIWTERIKKNVLLTQIWRLIGGRNWKWKVSVRLVRVAAEITTKHTPSAMPLRQPARSRLSGTNWFTPLALDHRQQTHRNVTRYVCTKFCVTSDF